MLSSSAFKSQGPAEAGEWMFVKLQYMTWFHKYSDSHFRFSDSEYFYCHLCKKKNPTKHWNWLNIYHTHLQHYIPPQFTTIASMLEDCPHTKSQHIFKCKLELNQCTWCCLGSGQGRWEWRGGCPDSLINLMAEGKKLSRGGLSQSSAVSAFCPRGSGQRGHGQGGRGRPNPPGFSQRPGVVEGLEEGQEAASQSFCVATQPL